MKVIREGKPGAWWRGMIGSCMLCGGQWELDENDAVKYWDVFTELNGDPQPSPRLACPNEPKGCLGYVHFRPPEKP